MEAYEVMSRMIPGHVRNQGIELYENGFVKILEFQDNIIKGIVEENCIDYSKDDYLINCDCQFFLQKKYCKHLAALESYLKNTSEGQEIEKELIGQKEEEVAVKEEMTFGRLFLNELEMSDDDTTLYRLSAEGELSPYLPEMWWTLRLNRLSDEKSYVVRDIKAFLQTVKKGSYYQIGKHYFEPLYFEKFDLESQELIQFLWRIIPQQDYTELDYILPNRARYLSFPSGFFEEGVTALEKLYDFTYQVFQKQYDNLAFRQLSSEDNLVFFKVILHRHSIELLIEEKSYKGLYDHTILFYKGVCYELSLKQAKLLQAIRNLPLDVDLSKRVSFDLADQDQLAASLLDFQTIGQVHAPKTFDIKDFDVSFYFGYNEGYITLTMVFNYDGIIVKSFKEHEKLPFASHFRHEKQIFSTLQRHGFAPDFKSVLEIDLSSKTYQFFVRALPDFYKLGKVFLTENLEEKLVYDETKVFISGQGGLLDISFDFSMLNQRDVNTALEALLKEQEYFTTSSGQVVVFNDETKQISQTLKDLRIQFSETGQGHLDRLSAFKMTEVFKNSQRINFSENLKTLAYDLAHPEEFELQIPNVKAELRDYQQLGVKWLSMLDSYGFGGILADDMGLGKTLQTISFLVEKIKEGAKVLILSPSSLIYNWRDEFRKFAPESDVAVIYGLKPLRDALIAEEHSVMVTSYSSFRQDSDQYDAYQFDYLILDEAQVIKNSQTKIAQQLRQFNVKNCFALSGTPIENKLLEIWSIFQIVLPGLLPGKKEFLKLDSQTVSRFIKPFVLRRKKEDVLPELPDLIEITYSNELTESQKSIYLAQLKQIQEQVIGVSDEAFNRRKIEILSGITRLRQICDTPKLFMDYQSDSGKIESLRTLLLQIKENEHRVLIFSQFRGMLDLAEQVMQELDMTSYKITGSTPANDRQDMTQAFNKGAKDAFLISLKAGGVGLNLPGADTVILIDLWWNPAVEMQAISRAHRIGQKENVEVYRLITRGTIEEKILELQESKKHLVSSVLDGVDSKANMTLEDIKEILGLSDKKSL